MIRRIVTSFVLCAVLVMGTVAAFCDKPTFISNARTAYRSYQEAEPLLVALHVPTANLNTAAQITNDLITAFEENQFENAAVLLAALIKRTSLVLIDLNVIKDETKRIQIVAILALGNIALHWISDNLLKKVQVLASKKVRALGGRAGGPIEAESAALATIQEFANEKVWGRDYKH